MKQPIAGNIDPAGIHTLQVIAGASRFNEWMYTTIRPFLKGEILEIGSGIGNISQFAIREGLSITLSDINPGYQQLLTGKFSSYNNVQEEKEKYDTVFYLNVIEHLEHDSIAVKNSHFLLKKGGNLIILAPAYNWLYCRIDKELGHHRRYTLKTLRSLFPSSRFSILQQQYFNVIGITGWFLFGKLFGKKQIDSGEMSVFNRLVPLFKLADKLFFKKTGLSAIVIAQKK
jgi:SAM-dependent methyltransferase